MKENPLDDITKFVLDIAYPIGSIFTSAKPGLLPPGYNILGVKWDKLDYAAGAIPVIAAPAGEFIVDPGQVRGRNQCCDPMTYSNLVSHAHVSGTPSNDKIGNTDGLQDGVGQEYNDQHNPVNANYKKYARTTSVGQRVPSGIGLSQLMMFGVRYWKRIV